MCVYLSAQTNEEVLQKTIESNGSILVRLAAIFSPAGTHSQGRRMEQENDFYV